MMNMSLNFETWFTAVQGQGFRCYSCTSGAKGSFSLNWTTLDVEECICTGVLPNLKHFHTATRVIKTQSEPNKLVPNINYVLEVDNVWGDVTYISYVLFTGESYVQTLHVGDRFTASGNDNATRDCCSIIWVASPEETGFFIDILLDDINVLRAEPYIE